MGQTIAEALMEEGKAKGALAKQRDMRCSFNRNWGDFVEEAQHDDLLPPRLWEQYVRQVAAQTLEFHVPTSVSRGDKLEIELILAGSITFNFPWYVKGSRMNPLPSGRVVAGS